jgi:hypothetical protein
MIEWLLDQFRSTPTGVFGLDPPWDDREALHAFVERHIDPETGDLAEQAERLPDDPPRKVDGIRFAPGAHDGAAGHHFGLEPSEDLESAVDCAIEVATEPNSSTFKELYEKLCNLKAIADIDPFLEQFTTRTGEPPAHLHELGLRLATEAPDREPVKFGIALLGLVPEPDDVSVFLILGRHDEFSLYSIVAIINSFERAEYIVWDLAKHLDGWGRIHAVEHLAASSDPDIQRWLLREGFRNSVMNEYLALVCAEAGNLADALDTPDIDEELLLSATEILGALLSTHSPAETIDDYTHAAEVVAQYLGHVRKAPADVRYLSTLTSLHHYLTDEDHPHDRPVSCGWDADTVDTVAREIETLLSEARWEETVQNALRSEDTYEFSLAADAAPSFGIDPWPHQFHRLKQGEDRWNDVMQTDDPDRVDRVLAYAEETLDLDAVADGPGDKLTADENHDQHMATRFIVQDLRRFPGRGWKFVKAGLTSPVVGTRNTSLRALHAWKTSQWPDDALKVLKNAEPNEPREDVRKRIADLVEHGEVLDEHNPWDEEAGDDG